MDKHLEVRRNNRPQPELPQNTDRSCEKPTAGKRNHDAADPEVLASTQIIFRNSGETGLYRGGRLY